MAPDLPPRAFTPSSVAPPPRRRGRFPLLAATLLALSFLGSDASARDPQPAIAWGRDGCGRLDGGVPVPCGGPNWEPFTPLACLGGRNYLHPRVAATVVDAWGALGKGHPGRVWRFGDIGLRAGGRLRPHKTHQNGLSADLFVPVSDQKGRPHPLPPTGPPHFGYSLEFDQRGRLGALHVDWAALGDLLLALEEAGKAHGVGIERIIVTPPYQDDLLRARPALAHLQGRFMKKEAWVRHDEHVHVDFTIPKEERRPLRCP